MAKEKIWVSSHTNRKISTITVWTRKFLPFHLMKKTTFIESIFFPKSSYFFHTHRIHPCNTCLSKGNTHFDVSSWILIWEVIYLRETPRVPRIFKIGIQVDFCFYHPVVEFLKIVRLQRSIHEARSRDLYRMKVCYSRCFFNGFLQFQCWKQRLRAAI